MIRVKSGFGPVAVAVLVLASAAPAFAQRVDAGINYGVTYPTGPGLSTDRGIGWVFQFTPRSGWGFAGGLSWFGITVDAATFAGVPGRLGRLNVRPLMGGAGYTVLRGRAATTFSVVGGPSINTLHLDGAIRDRVSQVGQSKVGVWGLAVRPGVSLTYTVAKRLDLVGFGGYIVNRPKITLRTPAGDIEGRWKTDSVIVNAGVALRLF